MVQENDRKDEMESRRVVSYMPQTFYPWEKTLLLTKKFLERLI
jgi:hypothetical protein